jgi:hypothetical protein
MNHQSHDKRQHLVGARRRLDVAQVEPGKQPGKRHPPHLHGQPSHKVRHRLCRQIVQVTGLRM